MQEHIEWLKENQLYFNIPIEVIENAEDSLEKEKEQIRLAFFRDGHEYWDNITFEEYYNQTYKQ